MHKIIRIFIFIWIATSLSQHLFAQSIKAKTEQKKSISKSKKAKKKKSKKPTKKKKKRIVKGLTHTNEFNLNAGLNSNGWQAGIEFDRAINAKKWHNFSLDFSEIKNPKEKNQSIEQQSSGVFQAASKNLNYGKANVLFPLKFGYGQKIQIGNKYDQKGIGIFWYYNGGISFAMAKPYYISVAIGSMDSIVQIKYTGENINQFLGLKDSLNHTILGSSGFSKGINESKLFTGVYLRSGLRFDFSADSKIVKALEVGVNTDFYFNKLPLMAIEKYNKRMFFGFNINLILGKKW